MNEPDDEITFVEPVYAPWDGRRVPVTLLGGYLGSGKTTLINEMLARADEPIAIFVNDVGEINIDARLIERADGDTLDLTGGCVCCSLKNGFLEAFDNLRRRPEPPEYVVVELSGVADPAAAASFTNTPGFMLDGIVVLADLDQCSEQLLAESVIGDAVRAQLRAADVIVTTKRDLVTAAQTESVLADLVSFVPDTPVVAAESAFSAAGLVGLAARRPVQDLGERPTLFDQHRTSIIPIDGAIRRAELESLVDGLGPEVLRAKGIVQVETGEILLVQVVGKRRSIEVLPMAELTDPTDLVVISL
ncbi:MAG: CobW family GTP-binding protein [Acidimicrobiales bacterium]